MASGISYIIRTREFIVRLLEYKQSHIDYETSKSHIYKIFGPIHILPIDFMLEARLDLF